MVGTARWLAAYMGQAGVEASRFSWQGSNNPTAEEDDGYLVTYVHNENVGESKFLVMDAKSPMLDIVAVVKLPCWIPCGFHGIFLSESELTKL
ncbi:putative carotenoid cleavage dioxygenase 4, chloroplastic [Sesamum angolense]|uniref:Carotenoid cleavage dioxygenase 4, chloroplastic n=1 Tax=Sesamum angolense TaxID=2727404 RepID=A0AAE1WX46_9LAMI|nr:putative carotenoid cleavage dioxygenase 4, chloroplastic [Sesamum angolense]